MDRWMDLWQQSVILERGGEEEDERSVEDFGHMNIQDMNE